jgi:hypothetical protein
MPVRPTVAAMRNPTITCVMELLLGNQGTISHEKTENRPAQRAVVNKFKVGAVHGLVTEDLGHLQQRCHGTNGAKLGM